jgi:hypothetical protein
LTRCSGIGQEDCASGQTSMEDVLNMQSVQAC